MVEKYNLFQILEDKFKLSLVVSNIIPMQNYMKNKFAFFGVRSTNRRAIFNSTIKEIGIPSPISYQTIVLQMMEHNKREMHYCAIDLAIKCQKKYSNENDISFITQIITTNSWWDSVDTIAPNILGFYFKQYPNKINEVIEQFMNSNNIWLQRSCLLFQLKYKLNTNEKLLYSLCTRLSNSKEFFIQKAIGWSLREYAKTNKESVYKFVDKTPMSNLSRREALKHRLI